ncbi:nucleosidase [Actinoplanes solisilvae]|uniref:nucleosidase n=1 Tax=Actinoplanes solisilvae TaxID=2486853 RepID=UPI001F0CDB84|nr:nucleosidase [Actinoplanes solisilvae]
MNKLIGRIRDDAPLLVAAFEEEARHLETDLPVLITGLGKVNAAMALTRALMAATEEPSMILNIGTAGALRDGVTGLHVVRRVIQHDLNTELLRSLTDQTFGGPLDLAEPDGVVLATGDSFIADDTSRTRLAARADLVDMEGYALVSAANELGVPIRLVKYVSDNANQEATKTWRHAVNYAAKQLASWVHANVPVPANNMQR